MYRNALRILAAAVLAGAAAVVPAVVVAAQDAVQMTSLTLRVHGCDGCLIQPVKAGDGTLAALWRGKGKMVRQGVVHWEVATRHTIGMSFDIVDPDAVQLDWMTNIVVAYRGLELGDRVPEDVAAHSKRADGCWAGTSKASVTLRVRVEQFPGTSDLPPPVSGYRIRPYLTRTTSHLRIGPGIGYTETFHGTIGNQDAYFCGA